MDMRNKGHAARARAARAKKHSNKGQRRKGQRILPRASAARDGTFHQGPAAQEKEQPTKGEGAFCQGPASQRPTHSRAKDRHKKGEEKSSYENENAVRSPESAVARLSSRRVPWRIILFHAQAEEEELPVVFMG